ncbi:MAG TPA: hypothetical protein VFL73_04665 [Solirubrobacteraceae bacterium]|nr:hypothetical protein [Solirubrobacteraceae bacterium]
MFLLLLLGLLTYAVVAPGLRQRRRVEHAVRAQHPEFDRVSCRQPDPLDLTKYTCTASDDPWTSCLSVSGSLDRPAIAVTRRAISAPGEAVRC